MVSIVKRSTQNDTSLLQSLEKRRRELRMSMAALARSASVSLRTVQRVLAGEAGAANLRTIAAIADALEADLFLQPRTTVRAVRLRAAQRKAKRLAALVQGTSALEDQAADPETMREIEDRITHDLLAGSPRRLWND